MNSTLTLMLDTSQIDVQVMVNNDSAAVINGKCVVTLDLSKINKIYLSQLNASDGKFFFINHVYFGSLNITQLMHYDDICVIHNIYTNNKIGHKGPVGSPDQMCITVGPDFCDLIIRNLRYVSYQQ
jgi:hypothetical protein